MNDREDQARAYLASLADPPLPGHLWQRVEAARGRRMRLRGTAVASVAVCVLALGALLPGSRDVAPEGSVPVVALVQAREAAEEDARLSVRAIDRALQAAYDRNASNDEIEPLWNARRDLLRQSQATSRKEG